MVLLINVVVHPSDEAPGFWRWAVHIGDVWTDQASCLNAGAELSKDEAALRGQGVAVAAARVAELCGALGGGDTVYLDADPITDPWPLCEVKEV